MKNIILMLCFQIMFQNITKAQLTNNQKNQDFPAISWQEDNKGFYLISKYPNNIADTINIRSGRRIDVKIEGNQCALLLNTGFGYSYMLFQIENDFHRDSIKKNSSWKIIRYENWPVSSSGLYPPKIALLELKTINILALKELDTNKTYNVTIRSDGSFENVKD